MYDWLNNSNNSNDGREIKHCRKYRTKESGQNKTVKKKQKGDWKTKSSNKETTDADNAAHQTGPDNTYVQQECQSVEIAKGRDITKNAQITEKGPICGKKHHQRKRNTGTTTKFRIFTTQSTENQIYWANNSNSQNKQRNT